MKRFLTVALAGVLALGLTSTAYANLCAFDPVPASTLLFPFVQYDYDNPGTTTLFAITNVSEQAQIVHITIWTDYSVAILDFNIVLTGYDVQTINIRDILRDGFLPTYDPDGEGGLVRDANIWTDEPWEDRSDPSDPPTPYPSGPYSPNNDLGNAIDPFPGLPDPEATWDGVPGLGGVDCTGTDCIDPSWQLNCKPDDLDTGFVSEGWLSSPANYVEPIPEDTLLLFQGYFLSSQTAPTAYANCAYDDTVAISTWWTEGRTGPAWMYVTADVVGACNKDLPDNDYATYFDYTIGASENNTGVIVANVLVGDVIYIDTENEFSEADQAVHIEASEGLTSTGIPGTALNTTFYVKHYAADAGAGTVLNDFREPLPTAWALRYIEDDVNQANTWVRAWKGGTVNPTAWDLRGPDVLPTGSPDGVFDPVQGPGPTEFNASVCQAYTVYIWDEDENVNELDDPGTGDPPWSEPGTPIGDPNEIPNLLPLETQEVDASEFFLVDNYGWMMFIWPPSNNVPVTDPGFDHYQTWMGARMQAFGRYSAGLTGQVLANYNCDDTQVLPGLGINLYAPISE